MDIDQIIKYHQQALTVLKSDLSQLSGEDPMVAAFAAGADFHQQAINCLLQVKITSTALAAKAFEGEFN